MALFTGAGVALITPFNEAGEVNYDEYRRLIKFQIDNGIDAIVSCGTTGEASTLSDEEHTAVVRAAVDYTKEASPPGKKIPVIAGAGSNDTRHAAELCRELENAGADACMLVTPYYNKTSQKGLVEHFSAVASAVKIPIVLYNIPGRTGMNIKPQTMKTLSEIDNIVAVKEASYDFVQATEIALLCGDALAVYSGCDEIIVPMLSVGGLGVISTVANIAPRRVHDMVKMFLDGDAKGSAKVQIEMLPLIRALFADINPMPVKAALNLMGFKAGKCRLPLTNIDDDCCRELQKQMQAYGLIA
ncbi:MAG: 4-hydroxy-tetrahydrodipicolinate synthase [Defluviitaleaceae bacterium]|nr:4-hydroxy-tetrahydrodipicolinate synthase [Defluviitaleaceae bacterium]